MTHEIRITRGHRTGEYHTEEVEPNGWYVDYETDGYIADMYYNRDDVIAFNALGLVFADEDTARDFCDEIGGKNVREIYWTDGPDGFVIFEVYEAD